MADKLGLKDAALVDVAVMVGGSLSQSSGLLLRAEVHLGVNRIPFLMMEFKDGGSAEEEKFAASDSGDFDPGKEIELQVGNDKKKESVFKGVVVKHGARVSGNNARFYVECRDKAYAMTVGRKSVVYEKMKDDAAIKEAIQASGAKAGKVASCKTKYDGLVQYYASDWDFVMARAEANGLLVIVEGGEVSVVEPKMESPVGEAEFGTAIFEMDASTDATFQLDKVKAYGWNIEKKALIDADGKPAKVEAKNKFKRSDLSKHFAPKEYVLQTPAVAEQSELQAWASSHLARAELSKFTGRVTVPGNAKIKPGTALTVSGMGKAFEGDFFVGGVSHFIEAGQWRTEVQPGLDFEWHVEERPAALSLPASGLLPAVHGLHTGIVKALEKDPAGQYRISVAIPALQQDNKPLWARFATFYASNSFGAIFYPELEDEVVVGFVNADPRHPVVLGSLYGKKAKPPEEVKDKNELKKFVSKEKLTLSFDEKDKIIEILTPGKQSITISDKDKTIVIKDANKNTVELSKDGITLDSGKDVVIKAKANVKVEAGANMELKAKANFNFEGAQVAGKAKAKLGLESSAAAEVKGSAMLTLKGGIVQIN